MNDCRYAVWWLGMLTMLAAGPVACGQEIVIIQAVTPAGCVARGAEWMIHGAGLGTLPQGRRVVLWDGVQAIEVPVVLWQDHQVRLLMPRDHRVVPGKSYEVWVENRRRERVSNPGIDVRVCAERDAADDERGRQLAWLVANAHGGTRWRRLQRLRFTTQLWRGQQLVRECQYDWDLRRDIVRVQWDEAAVTVPLRQRPLDERARTALALWQTDSQWLLLPLRLAEPAVRAHLAGTRVVEGRPYEVLQVEWDAAGAGGGGACELFIEPRSYRVVYSTQWTEPPAAAVMVWDQYKRVGPLWLATELRTADQRISYRDISVE